MTTREQDKSGKKLQTDFPLSEKDEVKKAEHKTAKTAAAMKDSVKADLKSRDK